MSVQVDYVGGADVRVITAAQLLTAGFVSPDLVWNEGNNHEIVINDATLAAYLVAADQQFKVQSPPRNFGELVVAEIYNHASAGQFESMKPKITTTPAVVNSTAETSLLTEVYQFTSPTVLRRIWQVRASGLVANTSGAPVDVTLRLRANGSLICATKTLTLASDAQGQRVWRAQWDGEINFFLANGQHTTSEFKVDAGATDTLKQGLGQLLAAVGNDPADWDVTAQFSVANANISLTVYSVQIAHSIPGTP